MSKKLRSFHKLFFIIFFSFLFSSIIGSGNTPDLPDRIAPELERIESLPRRTKPAELNIEVTKIKSELLEEVYIDRKNKNIYVDFSKKREQTLRGIKDAEDLEKKYNLIVSESIQGNSEVNGRDKSRNKSNSQVMNYEIVEYDGKKVLKIPYENETEKFYISVQENGSGKLIKVYGVDIEKARNVEKQVIERKEATVMYLNGYHGGWVTLNSNGSINDNGVELTKENFTSGNITGFNYGCTSTKHNHNILVGIENNKPVQIPESLGANYSDRYISIGEMQIFMRISCNGGYIQFYISKLPTNKKTYKLKILHTNTTGQIKEHTLNLTEGYLEELMTITNSLRDIIIQDTENIEQNIYNFGNVSLEETSPIVMYNQAFPVIGLGPELEINRDGWRAETYNTNEKRTISIIDSFKNGNNNILNVNLYFTNINTNGGTLLERSTQEVGKKEITAMGSHKLDTREKIGGDLVAEINLDELKTIFSNFRSVNSTELILSSSKPVGEQLTFAGGEALEPTSNYYRYLAHQSKVFKKSMRYPKIKIVKPQITEDSQLKINKTFNTDNYIVFNANGINPEVGATCPIPGTRSLKSLHFNGTYILNNGNKIDIDTNGNSVVNTIDILNGSKTLSLEIKYENRYPKIKILNKPMAGTYRLNIKHYEPSSLERLNYNLDIIITEDFQLPEPNMINTNNLKEVIIEDDIETEKYKIVNNSFGTVSMEQLKLVNGKEIFPVIALGNKIGINGWSFVDSTTPIKNRDDIIVDFKKDEVTIPIKMKLTKLRTSSDGINVGNETNLLGVYSNNNLERLQGSLSGEIQPEANLEKIIEEFRNKSEREIDLYASNRIDEQISYVIGEVKNNLYNVPTQSEVSPADKIVYNLEYPNIKILKPLLKETIKLTIPENTKIITFKDNGIVEGAKVESDKGRYLKSLHYDSLFNINDGEVKAVSSIGSENYDVVLNNKNNDGQLSLRVQYVGRYPKLTVLNNPKPGNYELVIKHFDKNTNGKLERENFKIEITIEKVLNEKEFEVTWNMKDIIIIPNSNLASDLDPDKTKIEYPDNWVKIIQLVDDKRRFPVIGINQVLGEMQNPWSLETITPLNPINHKPFASLALKASNGTNIKVPINIRETPFQKAEKFLVYDRGDMTNRNTAVGAYTRLNSQNTSPLNNIVQVDFQMIFENIPTSQIMTILNYANERFAKGETKVEIPYSINDDNHKILAIRGIQEQADKYKISSDNVLNYGKIDFPKIYVIKNESIIDENTAILNFINPVPKSNGDISGTFDITHGSIQPNNISEYNHPNALTVSGVTSSWYGFSKIPEYHKVKIYKGTNTDTGITPAAEFMTAENGDIKGTHTIEVDGNKYIFMKGKTTPLAIGVSKWDFLPKENSIITVVHYNSIGRVVAKDIYKINIESFLPRRYLDKSNSTVIDKIDSNKKLKIIANARQDFIDLGSLKLQNYQKDITKTSEDPIGVRIEIDGVPITLRASDGTHLFGNLEFDNEKTNISNPNEAGVLRFVIDKRNNFDTLVGKTFTIENSPLLFIKGGNTSECLLEGLTITLQDAQAGELPEMSFISTLNALTVPENTIKNGVLSFVIPGTVTLKQLTGGQGNSVPAIAIGDYSDWELIGGNRRIPRKNRVIIRAKYQIGNKIIEVEPELHSSSASVDGGVNIYGEPIQANLYTEKTRLDRVLTALTWVTARDTRNERITTGLKLNINSNQLATILDEMKNIPGDRIELKPQSSNKLDSNNKAKIAYIHARDEGLIGDSSEGNKLSIPANTSLVFKYAYEILPSIFIEKEKTYKDLSIKVFPNYILGESLSFSATGTNLPAGVEINPSNDTKILEGLNYEHTIKLTLPGGIIKEYKTDVEGSLKVPIVETIEKNGKVVVLSIEYNSWNETIVKVMNRNGSQYFDLILEHVDPSGDTRKTTNIRINSGVVEGNTINGEIDLTISSRYNPIDGQLNSEPILITKYGIKYQTEVLDLKLLNGDYPTELKVGQRAYIQGTEILENNYTTVTLDKGTKIKVKREINGDLKIKPIYWNYSVEDEFVLEYKTGDTLTNQYKFNVKCPEFFVASAGVLDFGKLYKFGSPQDKTVTTNIKLNYNTNVEATYTLDISQGDLNVEDEIFNNWLYLDDNKNLLVKNLSLGEEVGKGTTERNLPLTGTIHGPSVLKASEGKYEKTIQILIHLK
ncbi:hypothetical protein [Cetobacterium sp.]|uniref:hypothetical protein n=1 Tax=Cetobacterium sp. TaxID=2071632 RepID=UPI003F32206B